MFLDSNSIFVQFNTIDHSQQTLMSNQAGENQIEHIFPMLASWLDGISFVNKEITWEYLQEQKINMRPIEQALLDKILALPIRPSLSELRVKRTIVFNDGQTLIIDGFLEEALCQDSSFFKAMWKGMFYKTDEIRELSLEEFRLIVENLYSPSPSSLKLDEADALLELADKLQISQFTNRSLPYLISYAKECNKKPFKEYCHDIYSLLEKAEAFTLPTLQKACQDCFNCWAQEALCLDANAFDSFISFISTRSLIKIIELEIGYSAKYIPSRLMQFTQLESIKILFNITALEIASFHECKGLTRIDLHSSSISNENLKALALSVPSLKELNLGAYRYEISEKEIASLAQFKQLTKLILSFSSITDIGLEGLAESVPLLEELDLSSCDKITDKGIASLAQCKNLIKLNLRSTDIWFSLEVLATNLPLLEELNLESCKRMTEFSISHIVKLKQLTHLNLAFTNVSDNNLKSLIISLPSLKELDLSGCRSVSDVGINRFNECKGSEITKLRLSDTHISDLGLQVLANSLPYLEELSLYICKNITDNGMISVAQCKRLNKVRLAFTNVTDKGVKILASSLPHLEELNLNFCKKITDGVIVDLLQCKKLNSVDLSATPISDKGLKILASSNLFLENLYLHNCNHITHEGIANYKQCKSITKIYNE